MNYTAIFQSPNGEIVSTHHVGSNNRHKAWTKIYNSRLDMTACLIALIDGDHKVNTHRKLFDDQQS